MLYKLGFAKVLSKPCVLFWRKPDADAEVPFDIVQEQRIDYKVDRALSERSPEASARSGSDQAPERGLPVQADDGEVSFDGDPGRVGLSPEGEIEPALLRAR